jgi:hypothetical protein
VVTRRRSRRRGVHTALAGGLFVLLEDQRKEDHQKEEKAKVKKSEGPPLL